MTHVHQIGTRPEFLRKRDPRPSQFDEAEAVQFQELYERMSPEKQREFWTLRTSGIDKIAFLLRWSSYARFQEGGRA